VQCLLDVDDFPGAGAGERGEQETTKISVRDDPFQLPTIADHGQVMNA
jgi:hypothetical protein